jgi:hypothetical protein
VAFDPDAWLKANTGPSPAAPSPAPAAGGGFDPNAWLAANAPKSPGPHREGYVLPGQGLPKLPAQDQLPENQPRKVSGGDAVALGAMHGASAGWLDEIAGALGAYGVNVSGISGGGTGMSMMDAALRNRAAGDPTGTRTQKEITEGIRQDVKAAREQHPGKFGTAEFVGGMLTPVPKGAAGLAVSGGAYGAGASEADTVGGVLDDAAGAAATSLVAGKVIQKTGQAAGAVGRKVFGEAGKRVEERATNALLEGTPARTVQDPAIAKLGGRENIPKVLKAEGLGKLLDGPAKKLDEALEKKLDEVGGAAGAIYDRVVSKDPGVPPEFLRDKLMGLADRFRHDPDSAEAIRGFANRLTAEYTNDGAINARELHKVVRALGQRGYGTNPQNPSMGSKLKREIRGEVLGVLQQHVDDVAKQHPDVGSLAELRKLNDRYGKLIEIDNIAAAKAERNERVSPTFWQRGQALVNRASDVGAIGGMISGLASDSPSLMVAGAGVMAATRVLPHVAAASDRLAAGISDARLVNFLKTSPNVEEFVTRAIRIGIPREAAIQALQAYQAGVAGQQQPPAAPAAGGAPPLLSGN